MISSPSTYSNNDIPLVLTPRDGGLLSFEQALFSQIEKNQRKKNPGRDLTRSGPKITQFNKLMRLEYFSSRKEASKGKRRLV